VVAVEAANRTASVAVAEIAPDQNHLKIRRRSRAAPAAAPVAIEIDPSLIRPKGASNRLQVAAALMKE